jgi:hypothetical protein
MRHFLLAVLTLSPALAIANGGPVGFGGPSALGSIQPVTNTQVRLVSEDLVLTLGDDGNTYRADARYVLSNPKAPRHVAFGVPVAFGGGEDGDQVPDPKTVAEIARGIRIEVAGKPFACKIVEDADLPDAAPIEPVAAESGRAYQNVAAWCVANIELPAGDAVPLRLAYHGEMAFEDWGTSKSALTGYSERTLRYALFPAGYWATPPDRVRIRLDTGPFDGLVTASPPPTRTEGAALLWELERPDLAKLGSLTARVGAGPVLHHRELVTIQTKRAGLDGTSVLRARASSELAPQGKFSYSAKNALDGDAATAWCEGKPGPGIGEWIEVRHVGISAKGAEGRPEGCTNLEGFALVPGYARSQNLYLRNNRLRAFRLGPCGDPQGGTTFRLERGAGHSINLEGTTLRLSDRHDRSAVLVRFPHTGEGDPGEGLSCVRLTILEVEPGTDDDTCISELRPVYNCG